MAAEQVQAGGGANIPNPDLNGPQVAAGTVNYQEKYQTERSKRLRPEGYNQYIDLNQAQSEQHRKFAEDPWIPNGTAVNTPVADGGHVKVVVVGAGWGGIQAVVKLIDAGIKREDILILDPAGGFGGTWYWNRYPGLMCDVESYIYLPLLEETGYMPKHKYSSGNEIRKYAELVCKKYGMHDRAMFQTTVVDSAWNDQTREWTTNVEKKPKGGQASQQAIRSDFVVFASGVLNNPKLADLKGMADFRGKTFHTSRWAYDITGGTPDEPELTKLKGKRVALVGTGATAVQAVPHLAKFAEKLYVVQRTPSAVDARNNRETDESTWREQVATGKGWWRERNMNFNSFIQNLPDKPAKNLVSDGWTTMPSYSALIGTPKHVDMENVGQHLQELHELDYPRQEGVRKRVDTIIKDQKTADRLKAWYPGWCKRPCFHDEYLPTFNLPHVQLVDTNGKGVDKVTEHGIVANGEEYEVDIIIWGTGFRAPFIGSPAGRADVKVKGRDGVDMEELAGAMELPTLHGMIANRFPNMFYMSPGQGGVTANYSFVTDNMAQHIAYILSTAVKKGETEKAKPVVEPTTEGQEAWAMQILGGAATFAGMGGCTPSYFNAEGDVDKMPPEQQMKMARSGLWGHGYPAWLETIEKWRGDGKMEGLTVACVA